MPASQEIPKCLCVTVCLCLSLNVHACECVYVKVFMSSQTYDSAERDSSHWAVNLGNQVVMGLNLAGATQGFQAAGWNTQGLGSLCVSGDWA